RTNHELRVGRSNNAIETTTMPRAEVSETTKYGMVLPRTNEAASSGAMRTCSIVPRSFSRTTDSAVDRTAVSIEMYAIRPGTRNSALRSSGLYHTRGSTVSGLSVGKAGMYFDDSLWMIVSAYPMTVVAVVALSPLSSTCTVAG